MNFITLRDHSLAIDRACLIRDHEEPLPVRLATVLDSIKSKLVDASEKEPDGTSSS